MALPLLVKVEWENGDVSIERPVVENETTYALDPNVNGNWWAYKTMCTPYDPNANIVDIKIGQLFTVEGRKYVVVKPMTASQLENANSHGHIVITLFDMD